MQKLFEKNIKFFYENLPEYYNLILKIKTRRFIIKNDNIFDTSTKKFIYPDSIDEDSKTFAFNPINNPLWEKKFFYIKPYEWEKEFYITGKIVNKLITKAKKLKSFEENSFNFDKNFLPTTAIFGLLSGKHLDMLVNNYEFQSLFVYEPNAEFFAISLYFVDWEKIYKKLKDRFFLWVNGKIDYFAIEKFYYERVITSTFCNLTLTTYNHPLIEDAKSKFEEIRVTKLRGWGTYEDEIKGVKNHAININKYPLFKFKQKVKAPFCIVANGKSLEKNIEFIRKNKDSMIIISVGTALKPLLNAGIESDFHIEQERIETLIKALKDVLPNYNGYFIGASVVNPKVFKMAKKPLMYIREGFSLENEYKLIGSSPIVGNAGFSFAAFLTDEIYLCGMDLGFRLNEKKHSKNSFYDNLDDISKNGIKVEGNFSDDIYTDSLFLSSKQKIEQLIKTLNLKVYNLSDGAKIKGATPLKDKTLPKIDKNKIKKEILKNFSKINIHSPNLNPYPFLNSFSQAINFKFNSYKELTGIIDFIEDMIKNIDNKAVNTLLKGSIFHILNNFYILSHKIDKNDIPKLQKILKKEIFKFYEDFETIKKKYLLSHTNPYGLDKDHI